MYIKKQALFNTKSATDQEEKTKNVFAIFQSQEQFATFSVRRESSPKFCTSCCYNLL